MSQIIQIKRGAEAQLAKINLKPGELAFTTDTNKLFIGSDEGNILLAAGKKNHSQSSGATESDDI